MEATPMTEAASIITTHGNRLPATRFPIAGLTTFAVMSFTALTWAHSEPTSDDATFLARSYLNSLMLGSSEDGAINYLLDNAGGKVELLHSAHADPDAV